MILRFAYLPNLFSDREVIQYMITVSKLIIPRKLAYQWGCE